MLAQSANCQPPDGLNSPAPATSVLLMVEDSHADAVCHRLTERQRVERASRTGEDKRGPESVTRFANAKLTGGYGYETDAEGIATVRIRGTITPEAWAWYDDFETITEWVVRDLAAMQADPAVKAVLFSIDSPGGYVSGAFELADAISALSAVKPTATHTAGYCCSAAYLQAAQTSHITAFKTAIVGSIGTRSFAIDARDYFAKIGVKIIPIDSGGMKSAGLIGTEITVEQVEYLRGTVKKLQEVFTAAVSTGRRMSMEKAQSLADGRVHVAGDALSLGLIDRVADPTAARALLAGKITGERKKQAIKAEGGDAGVPCSQGAAADSQEGSDTIMSQPNQGAAPANGKQEQPAGGAGTDPKPAEQKPASMAELKAACPAAASDFLVDQAEKHATAQEAKDAFIHWQAAQIKARDEELAKTRRQAAPKSAVGGRPLSEAGVKRTAGDDVHEGGDAVQDFNAAVTEQMKKAGYTDRKKAITAVCRSQPELHQAYMLATNPNPKLRQAINDRFAG